VCFPRASFVVARAPLALRRVSFPRASFVEASAPLASVSISSRQLVQGGHSGHRIRTKLIQSSSSRSLGNGVVPRRSNRDLASSG